MVKRILTAERGFTLIELLGVLAIVTIVFGIAYHVLFSVIQYNEKSQAAISLKQEANSVISDIKHTHQGDSPYRICYGDLLWNENLQMQLSLNTTIINNTNQCVEQIDPKQDLAVQLTLYDSDNNSIAIETTIEGKTDETLVLKRKNGRQNFYDYLLQENVFVHGSQFVFEGSRVNGPNASIVIKGDWNGSQLNGGALTNTSNLYIDGDVFFDGGSAGLGSSISPGNIVVNGNATFWSGRRAIYGNMFVNGDLRLKDAEIHGNVYVNGNVELGWTPSLSGESSIFYIGNLSHPANYSNQILKKVIRQESVAQERFPTNEIPDLKADEWFDANGYTEKISGNQAGKIIGDNVQLDSYNDAANGQYVDSFTDFIIVSKGDIQIGTKSRVRKFSGVVIAPNGKVTFNGETFEGIVIARDGFFVRSGGTQVDFQQLGDYFRNAEDFPLVD
ncbi:prepilin-type N-terminal cleavage/methylation domain-containing protein [Ornithinibacillus contaminans]|uniref:prepilin-type N-terminal cleavage/methylation domain-containing protein n=1 Tax=Ornithinibacillus contaminans TaxID=694055 RepID=UPI00064D8F42|nr:prepilin-type N-terminal cleavage/methylation domain-containing protein [Ornithinibacillus contaminans]